MSQHLPLLLLLLLELMESLLLVLLLESRIVREIHLVQLLRLEHLGLRGV